MSNTRNPDETQTNPLAQVSRSLTYLVAVVKAVSDDDDAWNAVCLLSPWWSRQERHNERRQNRESERESDKITEGDGGTIRDV